MPTANEQLFDLGIRHQVGLQRLSAGIDTMLQEQLQQTDERMLNDTSKRVATLLGSVASVRLGFLFNSARDINKVGVSRIGDTLRGELKQLTRYEQDFQARLLGSVLPDAAAAKITKVGASALNEVLRTAHLGGRYLSELLRDFERNRFQRYQSTITASMLRADMSVDEMIRTIRGTSRQGFRDGVLQVSRRHLGNMVRGMVNNVAAATRSAFADDNPELIAGEQWVATLDEATCEECAALDGTIFAPDEGERPPAHPSCRCYTVPILRSWRAMGIRGLSAAERGNLDGVSAPGMRYQGWLRMQTRAVQIEALGPARARLFREGGLDITRFVDVRGNILTLDELRRTEASAFDRVGLE